MTLFNYYMSNMYTWKLNFRIACIKLFLFIDTYYMYILNRLNIQLLTLSLSSSLVIKNALRTRKKKSEGCQALHNIYIYIYCYIYLLKMIQLG